MLTPIQSGVLTLRPFLDDLFNDLDEIARDYAHVNGVAEKIIQAADGVRHDYGWILENALDAAERVQTRTRDIADAVKGEVTAPVFEEADLNITVTDVVRSLRPVAEGAHIHLHMDFDPALPPVQFDRKQMYNALYNLVHNAISATPPDGSVTIRTCLPEPDSGTLKVEVQDTGSGIPEHVRRVLFTDNAISTKVGGTGLGTRIVAGVVQRHGGTITVDSQEGQGSTFSICLPLRQPN